MRVLIAGVDGYLGWPLALHLVQRGHVVAGIDGLYRRQWVREMQSWSAIPITSPERRLQAVEDHWGARLPFWKGNLRSFALVERVFKEFAPDAVVHLGECPSAPYSMMDVSHAKFVQLNNLETTMNLLYAIHRIRPGAHLVKLGTMGEYGTPNVDIPEGFFEVEYHGRRDVLPFPRQAGSWYHWSKVHGSNAIMFACRNWGLRATDIMQGVVFGVASDPMMIDSRFATRVDFDEAFGTLINRFCCEAIIGSRLTPYGSGGQRRGFIPLRDSLQCMTLAIEKAAAPGTYRVVNQFEEVFSVSELVHLVQRAGRDVGLRVTVHPLRNPRKESEKHYYNPERKTLDALGYKPTRDVLSEVRHMLEQLAPWRSRILAKRSALLPRIRWTR